MHLHRSTSSFTLVELLVVIGILAILTAAVVIVLNPAELLKQSRDSKRTTDLANLNNAIKLLLTQNPDVNLGAASTVYISLADSSSTCGSYSLPALPSGWQYRCATSANYQKTDSSGWIPVSFAAAGGVANLPSLPTDPQNTVQNYYSYIAGGSWQISTVFESAKYAGKEAADGGMNPASYEVGSNLSLAPFVGGLVGYWNFDEGSGSTARDWSGFGNNGSLLPASSTPAWVSGKFGYGLSFLRANSTTVSTPVTAAFQDFSVMLWFKDDGTILDYERLIDKNYGGGFWVGRNGTTQNKWGGGVREGSDPYGVFGTCTDGTWCHIASIRSGSTHYLYLNGVLTASNAVSASPLDTTNIQIGNGNTGQGFGGIIDDVRVYNRALSAAEIKAIYDSTK